jgi:hypothetical protein
VIQIDAIRVREFRGIRDLTITPDSESFAIWGPNGAGKSGIVDGIDFALTGNVPRLAGRGSAGLSVLRHAPHVHRRDDPAAAIVDLTVRDTSTGKSAVLTRSVKTAKSFSLTPDDPDVRAAVESAQAHPELTLSRRDVIKYILAEPGARAQAVQALLKLDDLEKVRGLLRSAKTKTASAKTAAETAVQTATEAVQRHFDLSTLLISELTQAVNARRTTLNLPAIDVVATDSQLASGVDSEAAGPVFDKTSALRDVRALAEWLSDHAAFTEATARLAEQVAALDEMPDLIANLKTRGFIETGLELATNALCPLCDTAWSNADLRRHLSEKVARFTEAAAVASSVETSAKQVVAQVRSLRALIRGVLPHASPTQLRDALERWSDDLMALETHLGTLSGISAQSDRLRSEDPLLTPDSITADIDALVDTLESKPDQSASAAARQFLIIAEERWTNLRLAVANHHTAVASDTACGAAYTHYCSASDDALTALYESVEDQFSAYYQRINESDESGFRAALEPSAGKLDLAVDFYGLGLFPPTAYHSEGHQDGMGICLYLALLRQLLGDDLSFVVLDDVVMSVDSNHRRRFCDLLKSEFPSVQFIITTHDEVWLRQMQSSGLIARKAQAHFHAWSVDEGPAYELGVLPWDKIEKDLEQDDVPAAAARLRRTLESVMADLAAYLRGQVVYSPEAAYELGDLIGAVKGAHGKWLKQASDAANSWDDDAAREKVQLLKEARSQAGFAQEGEQWAVNPAVHYNDWATFTRDDFLPVIAAWKQLLNLFTCANDSCESWIFVSGPKGNEDALRCRCGDYNLNLLRKQ